MVKDIETSLMPKDELLPCKFQLYLTVILLPVCKAFPITEVFKEFTPLQVFAALLATAEPGLNVKAFDPIVTVKESDDCQTPPRMTVVPK